MKKSRHRLLSGSKAEFDAFVSGRPAHTETSLPLTHITDAYDLRDIIQSKAIEPRNCSVFNADLSYFYYGRPAYRKNGDIQANNIAAYAPVVFILQPSIGEDAALAFPFDSGAFKDERYDDLTHHRMKVEDFGLDPSCEKFGKLVACFYGKNQAYYDQISEANPSIPQMSHEAQTYKNLISSPGKNRRDDRSTTIEVILDKVLDLSGNVIAIVVPNSLFSDPDFKKLIRRFGCKVLSYADGAKITPASSIPLLQDVVRRFYIKQKILV